MKTEKLLGKITSAEFGQVKDRKYLFGLQLTFRMGNYGTSTDQYCENISEECDWGEDARQIAITKTIDGINKILTDAKCHYVSQLVNKPVEVTFEGNTFKDFRILTEVL